MKDKALMNSAKSGIQSHFKPNGLCNVLKMAENYGINLL